MQYLSSQMLKEERGEWGADKLEMWTPVFFGKVTNLWYQPMISMCASCSRAYIQCRTYKSVYMHSDHTGHWGWGRWTVFCQSDYLQPNNSSVYCNNNSDNCGWLLKRYDHMYKNTSSFLSHHKSTVWKRGACLEYRGAYILEVSSIFLVGMAKHTSCCWAPQRCIPELSLAKCW